MQRLAYCAAIAAVLALSGPVLAQPKGGVAVEAVEAIVTVVKIDREARLVTFRGPRGNTAVLNVPKEAQNLDQVKPGDRFKLRYAEAAAVAITRGGGKPGAKAGETVTLAPKGGNPGGSVVRQLQVTGVVDAIDYNSRYITLRGPQGVHSFRVANDVKDFEQLNGGDRITVAFTQALAIEMIPVEKPKAAAKGKK